jgi:hypothetical protein
MVSVAEVKRNLKVNLEDLIAALDNGFDELRYFLDLEMGEVVMVTAETYQHLEIQLEKTQAETIEAVNGAVRNDDGSDREKDELYSAALVEFGYGSRFIRIPRADSRTGYEDVEAFIENVSHPL